MDSVDRLLKYDPIAEAEKISGKGHWSNFSEQDNMFALLLNMQHAENKEKVLKGNKDTYFSMSWYYLMEVLSENGFKVGTEWEFIDDQYNQTHKEKAGIYYREDGVVVFAESHNDCKSVNGGKCFYELEMKEGVSDREFFHLLHTGCCYGENKLENQLDIREGLIHELNKAAMYGNFIKIWKNRRSLWILDYMESHKKIDHDAKYEVWNKQYKEVTMEHISKCPKELKVMVSCCL